MGKSSGWSLGLGREGGFISLRILDPPIVEPSKEEEKESLDPKSLLYLCPLSPDFTLDFREGFTVVDFLVMLGGTGVFLWEGMGVLITSLLCSSLMTSKDLLFLLKALFR